MLQQKQDYISDISYFFNHMADALQSLTKTVNAWDSIPNYNKMILLLGYSYTGRSTFAELINKYQFGIKNDSLIFEKDKYTLENVISSKSIKVQTTLPVLYRQESQGEMTKDYLSVIDVPAYSLTPQTKKWTAYEQKLTWTLMSQKKSDVGFLLFIQEKNTRANITSWSKTLISFLDMYKEYPNQLINSVGWVITKCGPEITEDAISKRLQQMHNALKKQKNLDGDMIDRLFSSILENKRFFIFRKCTGTEDQEIKNIYKELSKIANYKFKTQHLKEITWTAEENSLFGHYIDQGNKQFTNLSNYINECLLLEEWTIQKIVDKRQKYLQNIPKDICWLSRTFKNKLNIKSNNIDIPTLIRAVSELIKIYESCTGTEQNVVYPTKAIFILEKLANFPFFYKQQEQQNEDLFQFIIQTLSFKEYVNNTKTINDEPLNQFYNKVFSIFCQRLIKYQSQNDNEAFYEACIDLLDNTQRSQNFVRFLEQCKSNILKFRSSKQLLTKIIKELESTKDQTKVFELILKISNTLKKEDYFREASKYYKLILCPGDAIVCLQQVKNESEEEARQLIDYMTQSGLFESAKRTCYLKATKFYKKRDIFGKQLINVFEAQRNFIKSGAIRNILQEKAQVTIKDIQNLCQEVFRILPQLKN